MLESQHLVMLRRMFDRPVQVARQALFDDLHEQAALARAGHAGDGHETTQRDVHVDVFQVVRPGAHHAQRLAVTVAATRRYRDRARPGDVLAGGRILARQHVVKRPLAHHIAPVLAGTGPQVYHPVRCTDRGLIMLDDKHGVAQVAQTQECLDEFLVVPLVQSDAGLVEHVQHADQLGANLRREPDALRLAARQARCTPRQSEIVQPDILQKTQPRQQLLDDLPGDHLVALGKLPGQPLDESHAVTDGQLRQLVDVHLPHGDGQTLRLEPLAMTGWAGSLGHIALDPALDPFRVGIVVAARQIGYDPLHHRTMGPLLALMVRVPYRDRLPPAAIEHSTPKLGRKLRPGRIHRFAIVLSHRRQQPPVVTI